MLPVWLERARRWEFWPSWLFYAPVAVRVAALAVKHRGLAPIAASNPGIEDGGIVGESKAGILAKLPPECTIPFAVVHCDDGPSRALDVVRGRRWTWPLVAKPDVGQRGVGVRMLRGEQDLTAYLAASRGRVLLQPYHPGPFEAGIFYVRMPGDAAGRIFSITDKRFPVLVGNGRSTIADLIRAHPRYRLQQRQFLARHRQAAHRILAEGERFPLALAGNHAQGTSFRDGRQLWTPALEARIEAIAQQVEGFYIGRFDVRYADVEAFRAGRDLAIVELNGATAESTNIYDPSTRLIDAYRVLFEQWRLVFAVGEANLKRDVRPMTMRQLFHLVLAHLRNRPALALAD